MEGVFLLFYMYGFGSLCYLKGDERMSAVGPPEVVTFGESMALFMPVRSKEIQYSSEFAMSFGGAESNLAIAVSRLGHRAGWFGLLGRDPLGHMILKRIRGEGVDVSEAKMTNDAPTGLMFRETVAGKSSVYYYRQYSAASAMRPEQVPEKYIQQAKILHVTGITCAISESARAAVFEAVRLAQKHNVKVIFDPNLRLKLWSSREAREVLLKLAAHADYFLPGMDELKLLFETDDVQQLLARLKQLKAVSIVKGGNNETLLVHNGDVVSVPYFEVKRVVDPIGAGDGFCAGFIVGLLKGYDYVEAVRMGNLVGALVIQSEGDWEGLPTWEQLSSIMNHQEHIER
jgi:2-dehydro-3-deoxygluconokinase